MLDSPLHRSPPNSVQGSIIGGSETAEKVRTVPVCFASAVGCGLARHRPRARRAIAKGNFGGRGATAVFESASGGWPAGRQVSLAKT
jgi:hypothetical protein